ncbi:hypothetical protein PRIPAC_74303, partial [Pristionchus pacificus]|uniref:Uncharacterized protein n=1 Tax=Pristionchus pacificus TaxID=54126 RepID=A0A2A6C5X5_PRIPA
TIVYNSVKMSSKRLPGDARQIAQEVAKELSSSLAKEVSSYFNCIPLALSLQLGRSLYSLTLKSFADYDALSVKAKADFEKHTCFRTYIRTFEATGEA